MSPYRGVFDLTAYLTKNPGVRIDGKGLLLLVLID